MRLLIFSQDKQLLKFFNINFPKKAILDIVFSKEEFFTNFYLYDYDLILLDLYFVGACCSELIEEVREENKRISIICLFEKNKSLNLTKTLSLQINYLLFKPDLFSQNLQINSLNLLNFDQEADLFFAKNKLLELSKNEHLLLKLLFLNQHKFNSKPEIARKILKESYSIGSNLIDVYIYRLRKILGRESSGVKIINRKNFGYKITACADS
jgi:DNA-binding response OmpR family regulator